MHTQQDLNKLKETTYAHKYLQKKSKLKRNSALIIQIIKHRRIEKEKHDIYILPKSPLYLSSISDSMMQSSKPCK